MKIQNEILNKELIEATRAHVDKIKEQSSGGKYANLLIDKQTEVTKLDMENQQNRKEVYNLKEQNHFLQQRVENLMCEIQRSEIALQDKSNLIRALEQKTDYLQGQVITATTQLEQSAKLQDLNLGKCKSPFSKNEGEDYFACMQSVDQLVEHIKTFTCDFKSSSKFAGYIQLASANLKGALEVRFSPIDIPHNIQLVNEFLGHLFRELEHFFKTVTKLKSEAAEASKTIKHQAEKIRGAQQ